ncbi:Translin [Schizophyllum commune]
MSAATAPSALRGRDDVLGAFDGFRQHLDEHHDRRERLIKSSRDATNLSKKVIFLLHRLMTENAPDPRKAARRGREKLKEVQQIYAGMADKGELEGDRFWRYQHQVSPGLQEYIEALSYAHYLEHETLISFEEVQRTLCKEDGTPYFPLSTSDYLLDFERLTPYVRELHKKQAVTSQSLQKIEDAAYTIAVRFSEYDVPPEMMEDIVSSTVANFSSDTRDSRGGRGRRDDYDDEGRDEYD